MLRAILNRSWRQHPTRHQLYGHLPPITKTIQVRRTRHAGHCWRSRDELISDILLWTPTYGRAKAGRPAQTYIQQLCEDTGCSPEDLPEAMNDRERWRERVWDIRASGTTWWWWSSICIKIQMLIFKQGSIKYHFLTLWYDSTWDWTPVSRTIVEHSTVPSNIKCFNGPVNLVSIIWMCMCASVPHLITLTLSFLEAAPNKTTAVRPSTSYPTRHPTKENLTCGTLQVK